MTRLIMSLLLQVPSSSPITFHHSSIPIPISHSHSQELHHLPHQFPNHAPLTHQNPKSPSTTSRPKLSKRSLRAARPQHVKSTARSAPQIWKRADRAELSHLSNPKCCTMRPFLFTFCGGRRRWWSGTAGGCVRACV